MKYYIIDNSGEIPDLIESKEIPKEKNAWVSPQGDLYTFEMARHLINATYLAIFKLGLEPKDLRKGEYFKESFDSRLLSLGWIEIKDSSWFDESLKTQFFSNKKATQKQMDIIFDFCEKHKITYPFHEEGH